jgi:hypothetical protein
MPSCSSNWEYLLAVWNKTTSHDWVELAKLATWIESQSHHVDAGFQLVSNTQLTFNPFVRSSTVTEVDRIDQFSPPDPGPQLATNGPVAVEFIQKELDAVIHKFRHNCSLVVLNYAHSSTAGDDYCSDQPRQTQKLNSSFPVLTGVASAFDKQTVDGASMVWCVDIKSPTDPEPLQIITAGIPNYSKWVNTQWIDIKLQNEIVPVLSQSLDTASPQRDTRQRRPVIIIGGWGCDKLAPEQRQTREQYIVAMTRTIVAQTLRYGHLFRTIIFACSELSTLDMFREAIVVTNDKYKCQLEVGGVF